IWQTSFSLAPALAQLTCHGCAGGAAAGAGAGAVCCDNAIGTLAMPTRTIAQAIVAPRCKRTNSPDVTRFAIARSTPSFTIDPVPFRSELESDLRSQAAGQQVLAIAAVSANGGREFLRRAIRRFKQAAI